MMPFVFTTKPSTDRMPHTQSVCLSVVRNVCAVFTCSVLMLPCHRLLDVAVTSPQGFAFLFLPVPQQTGGWGSSLPLSWSGWPQGRLHLFLPAVLSISYSQCHSSEWATALQDTTPPKTATKGAGQGLSSPAGAIAASVSKGCHTGGLSPRAASTLPAPVPAPLRDQSSTESN